MIVLKPKDKDPEYNVKVIHGLCGGGQTYFTFGTLLYDRSPTFNEIVSKLPDGYSNQKVLTVDPAYWDLEYRVFGFTSKDLLVMN